MSLYDWCDQLCICVCHLSRCVCMIVHSLVTCVHMCCQSPKPTAQIGAAKPNSTHGKEWRRLSINSSTSRRQWEDQSTLSTGTKLTSRTSTSLTTVAKVGLYQTTHYARRLITGPCNIMNISNHFLFPFRSFKNKTYYRGKYAFILERGVFVKIYGASTNTGDVPVI